MFYSVLLFHHSLVKVRVGLWESQDPLNIGADLAGILAEFQRNSRNGRIQKAWFGSRVGSRLLRRKK